MSDPSNIILLMPESAAVTVRDSIKDTERIGRLLFANSRGELSDAFLTHPWHLLVAFGTGVIVPKEILDTPGLCAINIHAASPSYPGRDPHHFAAYDGATGYGATMHFMTPAVDQGDIIAASLFTMPEGARPIDFLFRANDVGLKLAISCVRDFLERGRPDVDARLRWLGPVRTRRDFIELCRVDSQMSSGELQRRAHAAEMPGYANLYMELHGMKFRLERGANPR